MESKFGLNENTINKLKSVFSKFPEIEEVIVYGSRAKGNYKNGSDIDVTLKGDLSLSTLLKIENDIEDLLLPYKVDLSLYSQIDSPSLKEHIERCGKNFEVLI